MNRRVFDMRFDVAVVGLGGMGSAILADCARRGASVIGLEQFERGHDLGSSSGKSRMIRKAYFEDPAYVPLLLRAYELWRELERKTGTDLLRITGLLMVGEEQTEIVAGARRAAHKHSLRLESLSASEITKRYPSLKVLEDEVGVYEPDGGVLDPEACVQAHLRVASDAGADMHFGVVMKNCEKTNSGFRLELCDGTSVESLALVLSLGAWFKEELARLGVTLRVQRNVQAWFDPETSEYDAGRFPPFLLDRRGLPAPLYGFPDFGDGVKAAFHCHGDLTDAMLLDREIDQDRDIAPIVRAMEDWMPRAAATFRIAKPCPYSLTPDANFVVDRHPDHPHLILCGGFSGHGFKFAPVIGEVCADLALEGESRHQIDFLSLRRFASGADQS
jgi:sarcosine oxidase